MFELAAQLLDSGHRVILDASFLNADERHRARALAADRRVPFVLVDCDAPRELLEKRIEARQTESKDASEANLDVLEHQRKNSDPLDEEIEGPFVRFASRDDGDLDDLARAIEAIIT